MGPEEKKALTALLGRVRKRIIICVIDYSNFLVQQGKEPLSDQEIAGLLEALEEELMEEVNNTFQEVEEK